MKIKKKTRKIRKKEIKKDIYIENNRKQYKSR